MCRDKLEPSYRARATEKLGRLTSRLTDLHRDLYFEEAVTDPMVGAEASVDELRGDGVEARELNMWTAAFELNARTKVS